MSIPVTADALHDPAPIQASAFPLLWQKWAIALSLLALFVFRLWYVHFRQLMPDETVYWQWSRHLQWGYLDHPPMLAAMIKASTAIFGTSEFSVRLPVVLLAWGAFAAIVALAHALYRDTRITVLVAVLWLTSPLWAATATIATPDSPAFFFSTCALAAGLMAIRRQEAGDVPWQRVAIWWLAAGVSVGLGLLSKYTVVLLPGAVLFALLTSSRGRRILLSPWPWIAGILAVALFMPVVWWNYRNGWVSFAYQIRHGTDSSGKAPLAELGAFLAGQMLVWTPVLFVIAMIVLWTWWGRITGLWAKKTPTGAPAPAIPLFEQILAWSGTLPLVFFSYSSTQSHAEINWPGFAYVPISLLTAKFVADKWPQRIGWAKHGCAVALAFTLVMHVPELILKTGAKPAPVLDQFESIPFAKLVEQNSGGLPVICNRHQDAGLTSFYMTGRPDIWAVSCGSRPTAFDYMQGGPDLLNMPEVMFVGWHVKEFCDEYGFAMSAGPQLQVPSVRKKKRSILMTHLRRAGAAPSSPSITAPASSAGGRS